MAPLSLTVAAREHSRKQRFGWGEVEPADRSRSVLFTRYAFLEMIRRMERNSGGRGIAVLKELSGAPFEEFRESGLSAGRVRRLVSGIGGAPDAEHQLLRAALLGWATRWGLNAPWCLDVAVDTLSMWRDHEELMRSLPEERPEKLERLLTRLDLEKQRGRRLVRTPFDPKTSPPTWAHSLIPDKESWELPEEGAIWSPPFAWLPPYFAHLELSRIYLKRARRIFLRHVQINPFTARLGPVTRRAMVADISKQIRRYCAMVIKSYLEQKDANGAPRWKETTSSADVERDLQWLVKKQVMGRPGLYIATDDRVNERTVNKKVGELLRLLGLPASKGTRNRKLIL